MTAKTKISKATQRKYAYGYARTLELQRDQAREQLRWIKHELARNRANLADVLYSLSAGLRLWRVDWLFWWSGFRSH